MATLVIEMSYALVFLHSFVAYLRRRDPVQRDLTLVFTPFTSLLVLEVVRRVQGVATLPFVVSCVAVTLLLAQPYLTMRLVRTLSAVPRWTMQAFCIFVATTVPFYFPGPRESPVVTLVIVVGFAAVQGLAATLIAGEARRRTGVSRARLALAAVATGVLGLCLLVAGAGGSAGPVGHAMGIAAEVLALLSGVSYVVAFMPPGWLRRMLAGGAAYRVHREMAQAPAEAPSETWRRYAAAVREVSGAAGSLVVLPSDSGPVCVATSGDAPDFGLMTTTAELDWSLDQDQPVAESVPPSRHCWPTRSRAGARVLSAVPVQAGGSARGALLLLPPPSDVRRRRCADSRELGAQAALLAERGAAAQTIQAVNAELEQRVHERTADLRVAQVALTMSITNWRSRTRCSRAPTRSCNASRMSLPMTCRNRSVRSSASPACWSSGRPTSSTRTRGCMSTGSPDRRHGCSD